MTDKQHLRIRIEIDDRPVMDERIEVASFRVERRNDMRDVSVGSEKEYEIVERHICIDYREAR